VVRHIKKALELASLCEHPNAVWVTDLVRGHDDNSCEEARQVFLGCENDPRALCFAAFLRGASDDGIRRASDLGDAFAQAWMAWQSDEEGFRWAEKSAGQGERDGFCQLGHLYRDGIGCVKDLESAKEMAAELGDVNAMVHVGELFDKDDPQRFVCFGRAAAANGYSFHFLNEMSDKICNFSFGSGSAEVVFVIGRALRGHIDNEKRKIFGTDYRSDAHIGPANQALRFYIFQLQCYRKAVDSWTIVGLRNNVVKDIRKMIGKMIWDANILKRKKQSVGDLCADSRELV
jgi:TPR repeat protein